MAEEILKTFKEKLYDCIVSEHSADALCTCIAKEIGNPVSIHLPSRTIVARSDDFSKDLIEDFINAFSLDDEIDTASVFDNILDRLKTRQPIIEAFPYYRHKQILVGCFTANHLVAILDCVIVNRCDLTASTEKLSIASSAVVPVLKQNGFLQKAGMHHMQVYLNSLLRGEEQTLYQQLGVAQSAINNTAYWQLIVLTLTADTDSHEVLSAVEKTCSHKEKIWSTYYDQHIVVLSDAVLSNRILEISQLCSDNISVIISDTFSDLDKTADIYTQCLDVYAVARITQSAASPIFVKEYKSVLYFLYACFVRDKKEWRNSPLMEIYRYDLYNDTEYYQTLRAYLLNEMNFNTMADLLHVHKNTIVYRMQRISDLFNLNLKDCGVLADLYLNIFLVESTNLSLLGAET